MNCTTHPRKSGLLHAPFAAPPRQKPDRARVGLPE